jgi:hypothetical protein
VSRALRIALAAILAVAGLVVVISFLQSRDDAGLSTAAPGQEAPEETSATLRRGNVVLRYADPSDRAPLRALAEELGGPADPEVADAGQAVLVERGDTGDAPVQALAYRRRMAASGPDDEQLRAFIDYWLGRGQEGEG